jgi:hypothetical protein
LTPEQQTKYRSGVGMLLYLVKHSRPDISNAVRELTKVSDGATPAHWKAMLRVIKYVIDTKMLALKLKPNYSKDKKIYIEAYSDSEFAGDRETRASVYGFVIFVCGAHVSWKSRSNKSVTLSSTEAEYYGASETGKEEIFVKNILESIDELPRLQLTMTLIMDNTGADYLANNQTTGQRTKHIDIGVHHVRNLITDGIIKTKVVRTNDNTADIFTKNTSETLFVKHSDKLIEDLEELYDELLLGFEYSDDDDDDEYAFLILFMIEKKKNNGSKTSQ